MIRILLWHPSALVAKALATVLSQEDDITVVVESGDAARLVNLAAREQPRLVLVNHVLGNGPSTAEVCNRLTDLLPDVCVLVLLDRAACARVGADLVKLVPGVGLVDTDSCPAELIRSIRRLLQGEPVIAPDLAVAALKARRNPLTDREREVLRLALCGEPIADIAAELFLTTGTVRNYLARITAKTGARTRIEAIRIAETAGWI
ncbi:MAG TPA: response regulator transcription factor [Micromonosporaceae bacterium]|nr:response regulator transcription factor [Micromonosporaceae bacterium]